MGGLQQAVRPDPRHRRAQRDQVGDRIDLRRRRAGGLRDDPRQGVLDLQGNPIKPRRRRNDAAPLPPAAPQPIAEPVQAPFGGDGMAAVAQQSSSVLRDRQAAIPAGVDASSRRFSPHHGPLPEEHATPGRKLVRKAASSKSRKTAKVEHKIGHARTPRPAPDHEGGRPSPGFGGGRQTTLSLAPTSVEIRGRD